MNPITNTGPPRDIDTFTQVMNLLNAEKQLASAYLEDNFMTDEEDSRASPVHLTVETNHFDTPGPLHLDTGGTQGAQGNTNVQLDGRFLELRDQWLKYYMENPDEAQKLFNETVKPNLLPIQ